MGIGHAWPELCCDVPTLQKSVPVCRSRSWKKTVL